MSKLIKRFLEYVVIDTESVYDQPTEVFPSSEKQKDLARHLVAEMQALGITDAAMDEHGYVYSSIPANQAPADCPSVGFVAHMDTTPDYCGKDVKPRIIENYQGGDIVLNEALGIVSRVEELPALTECVGHDLIVTDGTTLLGGDDKAGAAIIMTLAEYLLSHPEVKHGPIKIGFTPDEEVGRGADHFDVARFGADYAFTLDGSGVGRIQDETFNAATTQVTIHGQSIHPGEAKNKMINALNVAHQFHALLPPVERPEHTDGHEGFYHLLELQGDVTEARLKYFLRDHDDARFEQRKQTMQANADYLNQTYGPQTVTLESLDNYYNMQRVLREQPQIVAQVREVMQDLGLSPQSPPMRGGTDGARFSFMGLPCPNIAAGFYYNHGRHEFASVQNMEKTLQVVIELVKRVAQG